MDSILAFGEGCQGYSRQGSERSSGTQGLRLALEARTRLGKAHLPLCSTGVWTALSQSTTKPIYYINMII